MSCAIAEGGGAVLFVRTFTTIEAGGSDAARDGRAGGKDLSDLQVDDEHATTGGEEHSGVQVGELKEFEYEAGVPGGKGSCEEGSGAAGLF